MSSIIGLGSSYSLLGTGLSQPTSSRGASSLSNVSPSTMSSTQMTSSSASLGSAAKYSAPAFLRTATASPAPSTTVPTVMAESRIGTVVVAPRIDVLRRPDSVATKAAAYQSYSTAAGMIASDGAPTQGANLHLLA